MFRFAQLYKVIACAAILLAGQAHAQQPAQEVIDEIRELVAAQAGPEQLGAGYAALVNFAVVPDISAASYDIDSGIAGGQDLDTYRIPLRFRYGNDQDSRRYFLQAGFSYLKTEQLFPILEGESIDSEWDALGLSLAAGMELVLNEHLTFIPALDIGWARLENNARYQGELASAILQPALEGILFDWDTRAWVAGLSLGLDYQRNLARSQLNVLTTLTHNHIDAYDGSTPFVEFSGDATTLDVDLEVVYPLDWRIRDMPVSMVALAGATTFIGDARDELGFEYFFEGGLALEVDVSRHDWAMKKLRLGVKAINGDGVDGYSLVLGYRFR